MVKDTTVMSCPEAAAGDMLYREIKNPLVQKTETISKCQIFKS
jgi:hypothetical protein